MAVNKKHTLQKRWNEAIRNERIFFDRDILFKILVVIWNRFGKRVIKLLDHIIVRSYEPEIYCSTTLYLHLD
jgi:hypothetical protein